MIEYSLWKIWFHPFKTLRLLFELDLEIDKLGRDTWQMKRQIEGLERDVRSARTNASRLRDENEVFRQTIRRIQKQLSEANAEVARRKDAEQQIAEFECVLTKVEEMKRRYLQRIHKLRKMVKDMKKASEEKNPEAMELRVITLDEGSSPEDGNISEEKKSALKGRKKAKQPDVYDTEWLESLPI